MEILDIFRDSPNARDVAAGTAVFHRGEPGDAMYVLIAGRVDVKVDGRVIETLEPGAVLGEMALVDDSPRSADAVAAEDSRVVPVDRGWFRHLIRQSPDFGIKVMAVMAARLRRQMGVGA